MYLMKRNVRHCPPLRITNCVIELVPGAKLPKPRMYAMTQKELEELRRYIDKYLARGFIQPSRSRMAALVLFREKKDGGVTLMCGLLWPKRCVH